MYTIKTIKKACKQTRLQASHAEIMFLRHIVAMFTNPKHWRESGDTREIKQGSIVVGVEPVYQWIGPGKGFDLLQVLSHKPEEEKHDDSE